MSIDEPGKREYRHHFRPPDPADAVDRPVAEDQAVRVGPRPPRPWHQLVLGQWPLFVTLVGISVGLAVTATGHWKRGTTLIGLAFAGAALLRLLLPERLVGLLHVRSKPVDVVILAAMGLGTLVLVLLVPPSRN